MSQPDKPLPDQRQTDAFFDALAGRGGAADGTADGAVAMRAALLEQLQAVRATGHTEPAASPDTRDAATLAQLLASGVFAAPAGRQPVTPDGRHRLLARLQDWLRQYWPPLLTAGLALICVTVVLPPLDRHGAADIDVVRGTPTPAVAVAQPEPFARALQQGLESRGVTARLVAIGDGTWSLAVGAMPAGQEAAVRDYLRSQGYTDLGPPPLVLSVTQK